MARCGVLVLLASGAACGGNPAVLIGGDGGDGAAPDVVAVDAPSDVVVADALVEAGKYGAPSTTYPAFTPWMGQLSENGGPTLTAPVIVTITWDVDTNRATYEAFGDGIGASSYWSAAVSEYGVGAATSGTTNHVHISSTPPTMWADSDVQSFITANLGTLLPAYTNQTIYVFYISGSTTFMWNGQNACGSIGGYHDDFMSGGNPVVYAVIPPCNSIASRTAAASHEIGEASTDPQPSTSAALYGFDDPYYAFQTWQRNNAENGDACEFFQDSYFTASAPFSYEVQRLWSNKQGAAGHSPCQPYTATYFNVAPLMLEDISLDLSSIGGPAAFTTKGYKCALGSSIQIPIGLYSDGATGPWTISVAESNPLVNPVTGRISLSVDPGKTSGVNGEQTFINVTVNQKGPINAELLTVISTLGTTKHYLPLLVGN